MKILIFVAAIWLCSCNNDKSVVIKGNDLRSLLRSWDTETQNALKELSLEDTLVAGKALLVAASLSDTSQYDFLERKEFINMIDSNIADFSNEDTDLLFIELREEGESVTNIKAIIEAGKLSLYTKNPDNNWYLNNSKAISKEQSDSILQLKNDKNHNQLYLWGNSINDILIITKVSKQGNSIIPIFNIPASKINYLKRSIFYAVVRHR